MLAELLLLDHFEDLWQWVPLVLLTAALVASGLLWFRPSPRAVRAFQTVMVLCVLGGGAGLFFHLRGNIEFEQEMDERAGWAQLAWRALHGALPALAPGALSQLGVLGLLIAYRYPAPEHEPGSRQRLQRSAPGGGHSREI